MTYMAGASPDRWLLAAARRLSRDDVLEVIAILVLFAAAEVCVRLLRLPTCARLFRLRPASARPSPSDDAYEFPDWARRQVRLVNRVAYRWPGDGPCLRKSLVIGQRLRSLDPALHVGVNVAVGVRAHAWVTVGGYSIDHESRRFEELVWG